MTRKEILDTAAKCVLGDREQDYGTPENNFALIANLWTGYTGVKFDAQDVACMMILMKLVRIRNGGGTGDSYVDIAGYAACGGEILGNKIGPTKTEENNYADKGCNKTDKPKRSIYKCKECHWYNEHIVGRCVLNKPCTYSDLFKPKKETAGRDDIVPKCKICTHGDLLDPENIYCQKCDMFSEFRVNDPDKL